MVLLDNLIKWLLVEELLYKGFIPSKRLAGFLVFLVMNKVIITLEFQMNDLNMSTLNVTYPIKLWRLVQEWLFEVFLVDGARVDAEHHEHLAGIPYSQAVHNLAATFASYQLQQGLTEVVPDAPVAYNLVNINILSVSYL